MKSGLGQIALAGFGMRPQGALRSHSVLVLVFQYNLQVK